MDLQLFVICVLTFVIHLIGTLAYAMRIAGVRTKKIAVSFALFNVLVLVSRTSNSFQGPFLAKRIELGLINGVAEQLLSDFRWLLISASLATLIGGLLIPTFQRIFSRAVIHFQAHRSMSRLLRHAFSKGGLLQFKEFSASPSLTNLTQIGGTQVVSMRVIAANTGAVALWTVGVFAALYAGCLNPDLRVTASTLSSVVNGVATIIMFVFIDPHLSVMTDDVVEGKVTETAFRKTITLLVLSRFVGTLVGQVVLVPAAMSIAWIAESM